MTRVPGDEEGSDEEEIAALFDKLRAWADSQPWRLPPTVTIRETGRRVLDFVREWAGAAKGSAGPEQGFRRLALAFVSRRLPDAHAALESFCGYVDQARDAGPDVKLWPVVRQWVTTAPEAVVCHHVLLVNQAMASKAMEEQEVAAAAEGREFAKDLAAMQTACRQFKEKWLDVAHEGGAGGAAFMPEIWNRVHRYLADLTGDPLEGYARKVQELPLWKGRRGPVAGAVARARRTLLGPLAEIDEQVIKAIDAISASFLTIELKVGKVGPRTHVGQKRRVSWLAAAGIPHAAIARFEGGGMTAKAVANAVASVRREMRAHVEQPRPSRSTDQPQPTR